MTDRAMDLELGSTGIGWHRNSVIRWLATKMLAILTVVREKRKRRIQRNTEEYRGEAGK